MTALSDQAAADRQSEVEAARRFRWRGPKKYTVIALLAMLLVLGFWEFWVRWQDVSPLFLPAPSRIGAATWAMIQDGSLIEATGLTLWRIFAGFALAIAIGVPIGLLMGVYRTFESVSDLFIAALYPLPKIALIPLLIIWLGTEDTLKIVLSLIGAVFPIILNTLLGVKQVDEGLVLAARDLGASRRQIWRKIMLPSALPEIFTGIRLGLGVSIILVVAGEMVAPEDGLGAVIFLSGQVLDTDKVFAVVIVLAVLGIVVTKLQDLVGRLLARWLD